MLSQTIMQFSLSSCPDKYPVKGKMFPIFLQKSTSKRTKHTPDLWHNFLPKSLRTCFRRQINQRTAYLSFLSQIQQSRILYMLEFRTLAAGSRWNEPVHKATQCLGFNPDVITILACHEKQVSLAFFTDLFIRVDQLLENQRGKFTGMSEQRSKSWVNLNLCKEGTSDF